MRINPAGLKVKRLVWIFICIHTWCIRPSKALVSMYITACSPGPVLLDNAISTKMPCAAGLKWHVLIIHVEHSYDLGIYLF